ncbi:hypothetical protein [Xenorhabdus bovienii]|uniref:hypothetical protein n=1 Tax=Xenorhabdus bovienii TaxID=40576 RepID=UPI0023B24D88|nr:hypothetical protein [Xenorhabdus bovienii]MDE9543720.1 hypothetical protein [Xenorhabdus bovienii]
MIDIIKRNRLKIWIVFYSLLTIYLSNELYSLNTSDWYRATAAFLGDIPSFDSNIPLSYELKKHFGGIYLFGYVSSYTYLLMGYAYFISLFTPYLDMMLLSSILKIILVISLIKLYLQVSNKSSLLFLIIPIAFVITSSNMAILASFYQEQVIIYIIPFICLLLTKQSDNKSIIVTFILITIISTTKSQFFYLSIIFLFSFLIFDRYNLKLKVLLTVLSILLSISAILFSTSATRINKYHAEYMGVYLLEKNNSMAINDSVDKNCIGVDSSGMIYNFENGAIATKMDSICYKKNEDSISFGNMIKEYLKNPKLILIMPFDKGILEQMTEDYFHVFKSIKIIQGKGDVLRWITNAKDMILKDIRFIFLMIVFILSIIYRKNNISPCFFILSSLGISQFYVSFFGEGYRDLSKHLFALNYSIDMILFILISSGIGLIYRAINSK